MKQVRPFVTCAVIVNDNGEYLLIRRANEPYINQWSFISGVGASKKGLSSDDAVIDEVQYDIGVEFVGAQVFSYPLNEVYFVGMVHVYLGKVVTSSIELNNMAAIEYKWFTEEELQNEKNLAFKDSWVFEQVKLYR